MSFKNNIFDLKMKTKENKEEEEEKEMEIIYKNENDDLKTTSI